MLDSWTCGRGWGEAWGGRGVGVEENRKEKDEGRRVKKGEGTESHLDFVGANAMHDAKDAVPASTKKTLQIKCYGCKDGGVE